MRSRANGAPKLQGLKNHMKSLRQTAFGWAAQGFCLRLRIAYESMNPTG